MRHGHIGQVANSPEKRLSRISKLNRLNTVEVKKRNDKMNVTLKKEGKNN